MDLWVYANLWKTVASFVKVAVIYTKVLKYACLPVMMSAVPCMAEQLHLLPRGGLF